uniref:Uncharacterized protein n=1 Tax=Sphaerodactylus townsendi TaxID=933632 RepID=A0ACB8ECI6_9SAUR
MVDWLCHLLHRPEARKRNRTRGALPLELAKHTPSLTIRGAFFRVEECTLANTVSHFVRSCASSQEKECEQQFCISAAVRMPLGSVARSGLLCVELRVFRGPRSSS